MILSTQKGIEVPAFGVALLGVFIGYMVWYFIVRFGSDKYSTDALVAILGVVAGGVVIQFMKDGALDPRDRWWYPIGLVVGWLLFVAFRLVNWLVGRKGGKPVFPALLPPEQ